MRPGVRTDDGAQFLQTPMASRAASVYIDAKQLLRRVKIDSEHSTTVKALQFQLHKWSGAYTKVSCTGKKA